jgi:hypothetical protein
LRISKNVFELHLVEIISGFVIGQIIGIGSYWLLIGNPFPIWGFLAGGLIGCCVPMYREEIKKFKQKGHY